MPEFAPSESKTARVTMRNPTARAFDYTAELYMGINLALMSSVDFHLEVEESKDIDLPVTMPSEPGTYPVYIGVFSRGESIALYKATEDVMVVPPTDIRLSDLTARPIYSDGAAYLVSVTATNYGGAGSRIIKWDSGRDPAQAPYYLFVGIGHPAADPEGYIYIDPWADAYTVKSITLGYNESKIVSFVFSAPIAGMYLVCVAIGDETRAIPQHPAGAPADVGLCINLASNAGRVPRERLISQDEIDRALADP